jgi:putative membrane protein
MWLLWILLIAVIVLAVKALLPGNRDRRGSDKSPLEVLQQRFARGEIDEAEYERKRKVLEE